MIANVETIDAGIASPWITVARRFRRNTKMFSTTRIPAIKSVSTRRDRVLTNTDRPTHFGFTRGSVSWIRDGSRMRRPRR